MEVHYTQEVSSLNLQRNVVLQGDLFFGGEWGW